MRLFYEFFAGGGMANAGLGDSWQCLFANDFCPKKGAAYKANWGDDHLVVDDIANIKTYQLPRQADLAWASFPCQDFSLAGNGAGLAGKRSGTFWTFWKLMQALDKDGRKPPIIALENVYGASTSHGGKDFEAIIKSVVAQGYRVGAMVIDTVHFLPQSRPRLFIVAVDIHVPIPNHLFSDLPTESWHVPALIKAFERLPRELKERWIWWSVPLPQTKPKKLEEIIEDEPKQVQWHTKEETDRLCEMMTEVNRLKVAEAQRAGRRMVGTIYRRMRAGVQRAEVRFDGVSGCLRTPSGGSSRQTIIVVNGRKIRSRLLSPREAAFLMGLDKDYILPEKYTDAYHLAGDGVAVPVVNHLARHIFDPIIDSVRSVHLMSKAA